MECKYVRQGGNHEKVLFTDLGVDGEALKPILKGWSISKCTGVT
jgi:hypothetical protein